jgi:hypothetical protein
MERRDGPGRGGHYDADNEKPCSGLSWGGLIAVSEDPLPPITPDGPTGPPTNAGQNGAGLPDGARLAQSVLGRFTEQARQTAGAAKARRVVNGAGEPGVLDLTPLRELLGELVEELGKLRLRTRIGRSLRQAADIIDPPA